MKNHIDKAWSFAITGEGGGRQQHNVLRVVIREKKRDYVGKIPKLRGGGLTQTHSIFFTAFSNSGAYKMA